MRPDRGIPLQNPAKTAKNPGKFISVYFLTLTVLNKTFLAGPP
jgi:hypothetical protein